MAIHDPIKFIEQRMGKEPAVLDVEKATIKELVNKLRQDNPKLVEYIRSEYKHVPEDRITFEEWNIVND